MKKFYKNLFLILCTQFFLITILASDSTTVYKKDSASGKRICSCQFFDVKNSDNSNLKQVVGFFAEKTLDGKSIRNFKQMDEYIRREKKYFEIVFVKSAALVEKIKEKTDCRTLYNKLITQKRSFQLYNIIQVDALKAIAKR